MTATTRRKQQGPAHPVVSVQRRSRTGNRIEDYCRIEADGDKDSDVRAALDKLLANPDGHRLVVQRTNRPKQRSTSAVVPQDEDD